MPTQKTHSKSITDSDKLLAALSYIWILFVIPFVLGHHKPFVYKHAKQGMALFILELVLLAIGWFPILGWLTAIAGWLFVVVCAILGISYALIGKEFEIPIIGKMIK
jgi:fumarate reductase subunit D